MSPFKKHLQGFSFIWLKGDIIVTFSIIFEKRTCINDGT